MDVCATFDESVHAGGNDGLAVKSERSFELSEAAHSTCNLRDGNDWSMLRSPRKRKESKTLSTLRFVPGGLEGGWPKRKSADGKGLVAVRAALANDVNGPNATA